MIYDLAIVGLGPAGATLARLLGQTGLFSVCAIDPKALDGSLPSFQKPCGGLLAPDAQRVLSRFDLSVPRELLATPQLFAVRTIDLPSGLERRYQRFYLNLDRHRFDLWLCSLIDPSVRLLGESTVRRIRRTSDGFLLDVQHHGTIRPLAARMLVGADGAHSMVRKLVHATPIRQYVAIQQWFSAEEENPLYAALFDERITDCYAWSAFKDGFRILGAALPPHDCRARFEQLKTELRTFGFPASEPIKTEACLVNRPSSPFAFSLGEKDAFLLGEAAGFVSPSSLEGISSAMESARVLALALQTANPHAAYRKGTRILRGRLSLKLLKCPAMYQPSLRRLILRSGVFAVR